MKPICLPTLWLLFACGVLASASAHATSSKLPSTYAARTLVTPEDTLRFDAGHRWPYYDALYKHELRQNDDLVHINPGLTLGLAQDLELGLVMPVRISPDNGLADPRLHVLYQFERGEVDLGVFGALDLGIFGGWELTGGVPVFFHWNDNLRLDTGGFLVMNLEGGNSVSLVAPFQLVFQASPDVFLGPETGVEFHGIGDNAGVNIPVGGFAGYTFRSAGGTLGDVYGRLRIPNVEGGFDAVQLMFGLEFYFDI